MAERVERQPCFAGRRETLRRTRKWFGGKQQQVLRHTFDTHQSSMDGALADRLARGEPAAFAELYDACADRLHHYLTVYLPSAAEADDVVQETFVRLARSRTKLKQADNLLAYVFAVARNEAVRLQQRRGREREVLASRFAVVATTDEATAREAADAVSAALDKLPPEQREIVELKAFGGLTLREIAEVTALPAGTVATRYRTALGRMREWLTRNECHE